MTRGLAAAADQLASYGRGSDTMLAHITPGEARFIDALQGGRRTNPHTGLPEYGTFGKILKAAVRVGAAVGGFVLSGGNPVAAGAASAAATKLTGGSWKQSLKSGAITGLTAGIGNAISGPSMWSSEGLKAGAGAAAPGILTKEIGGVGTGALLTQEAAKEAAKQTALGGLYSGIGGATGTAVGLSALTGAPLGPTGSEPPPPGLPPGFGGNINLNVAPLGRNYVPYTGDYANYRGHRFFDPTNPKPTYLPPIVAQPTAAEDELEQTFMARGGGVRRVKRAKARATMRFPAVETADKIPAMLSVNENIIDAGTIRAAGLGNPEKGHQEAEKWKRRMRARAGMKNPNKPPAFGGA